MTIRPWAPLGAILLVLFIAIEPLTQQSVNYVSLLGTASSGQSASSPRAVRWAFVDDSTFSNGQYIQVEQYVKYVAHRFFRGSIEPRPSDTGRSRHTAAPRLSVILILA